MCFTSEVLRVRQLFIFNILFFQYIFCHSIPGCWIIGYNWLKVRSGNCVFKCACDIYDSRGNVMVILYKMYKWDMCAGITSCMFLFSLYDFIRSTCRLTGTFIELSLSHSHAVCVCVCVCMHACVCLCVYNSQIHFERVCLRACARVSVLVRLLLPDTLADELITHTHIHRHTYTYIWMQRRQHQHWI